MTFLPATVQGRWFYLYLILDLYSRKIVGFEVHDTDSADHAAHLARRTALTEGVHAMPVRPVLHGDNGATLKGTTVLTMLHWLGIEPSYSRPRVSDDNPYAEAVFRTAKYRPEFPVKGFAELDAAREWAARFVHWYNDEHRHSGIRYVTPSQRHAGRDRGLLAGRHELYQRARQSNPRRWSGQTRDWTPVAAVTLNPERDSVIRAEEVVDISHTLTRYLAAAAYTDSPFRGRWCRIIPYSVKRSCSSVLFAYGHGRCRVTSREKLRQLEISRPSWLGAF